MNHGGGRHVPYDLSSPLPADPPDSGAWESHEKFGGYPAVAYLLLVGVASCRYFLLVERPSMGKNWPRELARQIARMRRLGTDKIPS
jgi:hypothetical protein